jgi:hypothetical protein
VYLGHYCGAELNISPTDGVGVGSFPDFLTDLGTPSVVSSTKRSGNYAIQCLRQSGSGTSVTVGTGTTVSEGTNYMRIYMCFSAIPASVISIINWENVLVKLNTDGTIGLYSGSGAQIGSNSEQIIKADSTTWYRIELAITKALGAITNAALRLEGKNVASGSASGSGSALPKMGWLSDPGGALTTVWLDDYCQNNSSAAVRNTSWCDEGRVVLAIPISDNQRGSWTGGVGGTTNLFDAVNNLPPIGTATETDLTQIESTDSTGDNTTDEYRVNLTTYRNLGIKELDEINGFFAVACHGEDVSVGTKTGSIQVFDNPSTLQIDTFTYGGDVGALGTFPSNWRWAFGSPVDPYNFTININNNPILAARKTDAGTRVASICFLGLMIHYDPFIRDVPPPIKPDFIYLRKNR